MALLDEFQFPIYLYGNHQADTLIIHFTHPEEIELLDQLYKQLSSQSSILFAGICINDWDHDLTPWKAKQLNGQDDYGDGAANLLSFITDTLLPYLRQHYQWQNILLGGYSLSGMTALWCGCQCDLFDGIACVSGSLWYEGFVDYVLSHELKTKALYLSIGNKERKSRHPLMKQIGQCMTTVYDHCKETLNDAVIYEINPGNHFFQVEERLLKAYMWLISRLD